MKNPDIKKMFETIAEGYDFQNRFLSLRVDTWWRKMMVKNMECPPHGMVLDVATGTAEIAIEIVKQRAGLRVVGGDFSPSMLKIGLRKVKKRGFDDKIQLFIGDARNLPFRESQFDVLTIAFGIRNIKEREVTLKEFYSVLKPGGQLIIMEFGLPRTPIVGNLYQFYFNKILPKFGDIISRTGYAYTYLSDSVHRFSAPEDFIRMVEEAGFQKVRIKKLTFGCALLFIATKAY
ncbi:MAG: bifunctional demethylmenaquinone methyltransferase/2-methoxy-6-polyprenyl-1,4-benzoquinol methylase UbiE [Pseudomonadota bacterium]